MADITTNVLVVDRQRLLTDLIKSAFSAVGEYNTESVGSYKAALKLLEDPEAPRFDLILLETNLDTLTSLQNVAYIVKQAAPAKVLLFSDFATRSFVDSCVKVGAFGFVPKSLSLKAFESVLSFVTSGQVFIPADFHGRGADGANDTVTQLKTGELDVLEQLSLGLSNKEIAKSLVMKESTVKLHVRTLCRKLGATNRTQALIIAQKQGILAQKQPQAGQDA